MFEKEVEQLNRYIETHPVAYEKRAYTVDEIRDILSIGKNAAYRLANSGQFKTVRVGSAIRISKKSFDEWLDNVNE